MVVDSSVVLAYLTGSEPASEGARQLFDGFIATGRNRASISTITVGEILVRPFRQGSVAVAMAESFLRHFGDLALVDVTYAVAREAARIRARTGLRMPDATIVASALEVDADLIVTSDRSWQRSTADVLGNTRMLELPVAARARS